MSRFEFRKYRCIGWSASVTALLFIISTVAHAQSYAFGVGAFPVASGPTAIASGDFNRDGRPDIAVTDGNGVSVLLGRADGSFAPKVDYSVGGSFAPTGLVVADVNGDRKPDLVVGASILLGNGDGTFRVGTSVTLNNVAPTGVAAGDFNKDGKIDLAVSGGSDASGPFVAILLGKGDGTFQPEVDYSTKGSFSVITGDFNGDGKADLAVGNGYSGSGGDEISILLGNGDGTFKPSIGVSVPGDGDDHLAAADLNHDGKIDLVVASFYNNTGGISVLLGNGGGTFEPAVSYPVPIGATNSVVIKDFNGDGIPDIAVTNYDGNDVSVFIGVGDGTFKQSVQYPASINPVGIVTGDFNGDGQSDIASVAGYILSAEITVLIGRGDGTFSTHTNHVVPLYPFDITTGDFNGDGKPDLVVDSFNTPGAISVLLGNGNGGFTNRKDTAVGNHPAYLATGDFNGDGKLDIVVNASDPKTGAELLSTLLGKGDGTFESPLNQTLTSIPNNFAVADFNLDGKLDLATCLQLTTGVSVFIGKGDGTFGAPSLFDAGNNTNSAGGPVFSADFNGDHKSDLAVSTSSGISILLSDGNGSFQPYSAVLPGYGLLAVGDFNGDGKPDLVVYAGSPWVGIALGKGDGTFESPATVFVTSLLSFERTIVGDFNGDGKLDIAAISSSEQMLSILPGNGDGTFGQRIDLPTENSPWSLTAAKGLTGGGGLDIAVGSAIVNSPSVVSIYPSHPVGAIYPDSLQFGSQKIGTTSKVLTTKLHNSGGAPLTVSAITTTGEFSQTSTCGKSLAVGSSCSISVIFKPTTVGRSEGTLNIWDSAIVKPQKITLSGIGVK